MDERDRYGEGDGWPMAGRGREFLADTPRLLQKLLGDRARPGQRLLHLLPGCIGIEHRHGHSDSGRVFSQVLLVDHAFVIDDKGMDAGGTRIRRGRPQQRSRRSSSRR